jgi:small subunit ribosomal protein S20
MANIKSQIKRITTNEKARQRNLAIRSSVKTAIRKFREAAESGDKDKALELQREAARKLDKAVTRASSTPTRPRTRSRRSRSARTSSEP